MQTFLASNPGLKSRFNRFIHFEDYTAAQLFEIFEKMLSRSEFQLTAAARQRAEKYVHQLRGNAEEHFGNGRVIPRGRSPSLPQPTRMLHR
jgi:stage V sporulation protein K